MHRLHPPHTVCGHHGPPSLQPIRGDQGVASSRWKVAKCSLPLLRSAGCTTPVNSGPEPPVYWSVCFGGQFFSASVFRRPRPPSWIGLCQEPGRARTHPSPRYQPILSPPLTCWGPAEHKTPPPWDDACIWRLIGGRVFALLSLPWQPSFFCPREMRRPA